MPSLKLTARAVDGLPPSPDQQTLYRDTDLRGFGVRVCKQSKTYFVEARVNGRNVRTTVGRADVMSPDIGRRKARKLLAEMADGINPNQVVDAIDQLSVRNAFQKFFDAKPDLASSTRAAYQRTCDVYLADWGLRPLNTINRQMVLKRHQLVTDANGAITANNVMRHFRSIYNFAAAMYDELPPNPVAILTQGRLWHREKRRRTLIHSHQLSLWWQAVWKETEDARDVMVLALFTGMRRGEIISLRWETVDLIGRTLVIPKTKNGDPLELPLSTFIAEMLDQRRNRVGQSEWVFPSRSKAGHIAETKSFTKRVSAASGVKFTMHDLRRTFITIAESLDIPAYALKRLLNHRADTDVTGGYIVISAERLREPVERIASRILELADSDFGEGWTHLHEVGDNRGLV